MGGNQPKGCVERNHQEGLLSGNSEMRGDGRAWPRGGGSSVSVCPAFISPLLGGLVHVNTPAGWACPRSGRWHSRVCTWAEKDHSDLSVSASSSCQRNEGGITWSERLKRKKLSEKRYLIVPVYRRGHLSLDGLCGPPWARRTAHMWTARAPSDPSQCHDARPAWLISKTFLIFLNFIFYLITSKMPGVIRSSPIKLTFSLKNIFSIWYLKFFSL